MMKIPLTTLVAVTILMLVLPAITVVQDADAIKSAGMPSLKYGAANAKKVCGDKLCSEIPGGYDAWKESKKIPIPSKEMTSDDKSSIKKTYSWNTVTGTITSSQDPGLGHESHQLALILPPTDKVYKGVLTYDASEPIQLVVLHGPLAEGEDKGQKIWTPDGETKFALTFVDPKTSMGSWTFAGNALAVHTTNEEPFTVSYSVAAWKN